VSPFALPFFLFSNSPPRLRILPPPWHFFLPAVILAQAFPGSLKFMLFSSAGWRAYSRYVSSLRLLRPADHRIKVVRPCANYYSAIPFSCWLLTVRVTRRRWPLVVLFFHSSYQPCTVHELVPFPRHTAVTCRVSFFPCWLLTYRAHTLRTAMGPTGNDLFPTPDLSNFLVTANLLLDGFSMTVNSGCRMNLRRTLRKDHLFRVVFSGALLCIGPFMSLVFSSFSWPSGVYEFAGFPLFSPQPLRIACPPSHLLSCGAFCRPRTGSAFRRLCSV